MRPTASDPGLGALASEDDAPAPSGRHRLVKRALSRSQLSGTGKHYAHAEPWYAVGDMENDDESETLNMNWRFMSDSLREDSTPGAHTGRKGAWNHAHANGKARGSFVPPDNLPPRLGIMELARVIASEALVPACTAANVATAVLALRRPWAAPGTRLAHAQGAVGAAVALALALSMRAQAMAGVLLRLPGLDWAAAAAHAVAPALDRLCQKCAVGDLPVSRVLSGCISWPLGLAGLGVRWLARAVVTGAAAWVAAPFAPLAQLRGCAWHVKNVLADLTVHRGRRAALSSVKSLAFRCMRAYAALIESLPLAVGSSALLALSLASHAPPGVPIALAATAALNACRWVAERRAWGTGGRLMRVVAGWRMASLAVPDEDLPLLHYAAMLPDTESLRLVLEEGVAENTRDARGRTAMHLVASRAELGCSDSRAVDLVVDEGRSLATQMDALELLLEAGADLFAVDDGGMTPLHAACHAKNSELAGAMVEHVMRAVGAASAMELVRATDRDGWTPLHFAASNGDAALVARLVGLGADVHATDHMRRMPLHMAAKRDSEGHVATMTALIECGADVDATDCTGATPWMYVAKVMDRCRDAEARGRLEVMVAVMTEIALGRFTTGPRGTRRLLPGSRGSPASSSRPSSRPSSLPSSLPGSVHGGVAAAHLLRASRLGTPHAPPHVLSDGLLSRFAPRMERIREEARAEVAAEEDPRNETGMLDTLEGDEGSLLNLELEADE